MPWSRGEQDASKRYCTDAKHVRPARGEPFDAGSRSTLDAGHGPPDRAVEAWRPAGAGPDWNPGAVLRLPFTRKLCADGKTVSTQALMAFADAAMIFACAAAWNGYRPMTALDQTAHFLGPAHFDLLADARVIRAGTTTSFGRVSIFGSSHGQPVAMMSGAYTLV